MIARHFFSNIVTNFIKPHSTHRTLLQATFLKQAPSSGIVIKRLNNNSATSRTLNLYPKIECPGILRTMKITTSHFHELFTPELQQLIKLFQSRQYELRIAGGAVRDLLMGGVPSDIDFATVATPEQMKEIFEVEGVRMINNRGESHGTITARINDQNFEVTTLRVDVVTDGRHAEVEFTKDWQIDANRRDLTINAMFLGFDGTIYDYFNGAWDLEQRLVRFVGEATQRIQEDYLRILRYFRFVGEATQDIWKDCPRILRCFRFYGRISKEPDNHESDTLHAISENASGLAGISGERLWVELRKIVVGNYSDSLLQCMANTGVTHYLGLPEKLDMTEYESVYKRSRGLNPLPSTLVSALLKDEQDVEQLNKRLKMSNDQIAICTFIISHRHSRIGDDPARYFQDIYTDNPANDVKLKSRLAELLKYLGNEQSLTSLELWTPIKFVVTGFDLFEANVPKGPMFSKTLTELRHLWKCSDYRLTKEELIAKIPEVTQKLEQK